MTREQERQRVKLFSAMERQSRRYLYEWNQKLQAFQVCAPEADGGRVLHTFDARTERSRAQTNAEALTDRYNRGITPRQMALI